MQTYRRRRKFTKALFVGRFTLCHLILPLFFILAFSIAISPIATTEHSLSFDGKVMLEKTVHPSSEMKPGDKVNFTITYSNHMSETAYNVTIFEWMPSNLTFISSKPFYDGVSDPEIGFYRWSRGNIPPDESGTVIVKAMVNNVPVGTEITNTAHLAYEFENGTRVEVTSSAKINVTQAAGVDVYPDQIHSVAPCTGAWTEFNVTVKNTGNGLDTFNISLRSVAYHPSSSNHEWRIELYNSTGYPENPVAMVYDDNVGNRTSWTDHGVLTSVTLASGESTWFMIKVIEAAGTSGSGDAYLDVHLIATSLFDPSVSNLVDKMTIVKSVAGITLGPDYSRYANPGDSMVYRHIVVNSGQTEVIDLNYASPRGWNYSFWFDNGTALKDTDGSGYVDIGELPKNKYIYILVKVTVPYSTAAGVNDTALITATGVTSGNFDTANDTTTVKSAPILGVDKKLVSDNPRYVGDFVTYRISITNLGNTKLTKIPLDDAFETQSLNFSSADPVEDTYDETAGTIHWENLTALESGQSMLVTVNFVATAADDIVRESANVIDAEDEFGNLISATYMNTELKIIGVYTLTVTASPNGAIGGSFSVTWTERGVQKDGIFTTQKSITCDQDTAAKVSGPESPITEGDLRYVFTHYSPSANVTMDSDKIVTLNYQTEYTLTFQQIGSHEPVYININGTQLPQTLPQFFWVSKGSTTTFSYPSAVLDTTGKTRYILTRVDGNTTDTSVTVNAPTGVTGFYQTQYYLDVTTDPVGLDAPQYGGWYDNGTYAKIEVGTPTGGDGVSTRYRFDHWTGTGIANTTSPSTEILMDAPKTATAHYVKQHYITIISLHDSPTPSQWVDEGDNLTASVTSPTEIVEGQTRWNCTGYNVDGETKPGTSHTFENIQDPHRIEFYWVQQFWLQVDTTLSEATVEGTGWYDVGTLASISAVTPYQPSPTHRFVFTSWASTGPNEAPITDPASSGTTVTMDNYYTVQANWQEQWYITVISPHNDPTPSQWVNATENLVVSVTSPADDDGAGTRYRCTGYSIDDGNLEEGTSYTFINVQAAHKIEFEWIAQRYLTVNISPPDVPETIPGEGWYDENTLVNLTAPSPVSVSNGVQYRFDHWTIDTTTSTNNSITLNMDAPKTVTAHYVKQFKLVVISDYDSPHPPLGEHWYDEGQSITASVSSPANESDGTRYRCTGWSGTGSVPVTGTNTSIDFTITAPSSIEWNWIPQHQLTIDNGGHGITTPTSGNWYDEGEWITITMGSDNTSNSTGTRYLFALWSGSGPGSYSGPANPCQVQMNGPITEVASWKTQYYLTVNSPYGTPSGAGWYDSGSTAYATLDTETVSAGSGIRYVFTRWSGDASGTNYAKSGPITMNAPKTATANWKRQYYLAVTSAYGTPSGTGWYDDGSTAHARLDTGQVSGETGIQYLFTQWSGDASGIDFTQSDPITMNEPKTANANWKTQYYLTVNTDPADLDDPTGEGWYDEGTYAAISVDTPTGGDGVSTRYRFHNWTGMGIVDVAAASTTILMDAPKVAEAVFIEQFYLTMSTNFGVVSPDSGWYDAGSIVSIEATAPAVPEGKGYVWHGWTGTGEVSYSGIDNPATVTMNSAISETAYWKIAPLLTITISNDTIASGDKIVVYGKMLPAQSGAEILVTYTLPNGTQIEHIVYTNDEGDYEDALLVDQEYLYNLFVDDGEWVITASRPSDISHETAQASTKLKIEARPVVQFHPALLAGLIIAVALIAYVLIIKKVKKNNTWWRATVILSCAGLIFGAASLAFNWMLVTGTATTDNATYQVDVLLYPLSDGSVSITEGIRYIGAKMPSMIDSTWQNITGSAGPVFTLYLVPVGCALALAGLYKPKNVRQRSLKVAILVISGVLIVTSVVHALIFVQGQVGTISGAGIGYGIGVYMAIISGTLTVLSGLFATRESHSKSTKSKMP